MAVPIGSCANDAQYFCMSTLHFDCWVPGRAPKQHARTYNSMASGAGYRRRPLRCCNREAVGGSPCAASSMLVTETAPWTARMCFGGAPWMQSHSPCTAPMLDTETARMCSGGAGWMQARTLVTAPMLATEAARVCFGSAFMTSIFGCVF